MTAGRLAPGARSRYNLGPRAPAGTMLTSAITAAIAAALTWFGIPPGPYVAGVWIAVKLLLVGLIALVGWRAARRARGAPPAPGGG